MRPAKCPPRIRAQAGPVLLALGWLVGVVVALLLVAVW